MKFTEAFHKLMQFPDKYKGMRRGDWINRDYCWCVADGLLVNSHRRDIIHVDEQSLSANSWEMVEGEVFNIEKNATIREIQKIVHELAKEKGWHDEPRIMPELIALCHSELSEALEGYRNMNYDNIKEEFADTVIRIMDIFGLYGWDLESEILKKHEYNKTRSYRHGGKVC